MQNLTKFVHLKKCIFIKKWLTQNMWHIGAIVNIINLNLQKISFENYFHEKGVFLAKGSFQKDNSP
jgi:hypothetical protein